MSDNQPQRQFVYQRAWGKIPWAYHAICRELRRHLKQRGWAHWQLDDAAGWNDGYAGKVLNPATPSGRMAGHDMLDLAFTALVGRGYRVLVIPNGFDVSAPGAVQTLLDEQDATEVERVANMIELAAYTRKVPKIAEV
ncbi:hypothetical protein [Azospirillum brasilense]|uniref:hypothetical protein n=1 Tax=Azospirillum brasilense TaxID=192 RepID=UPI0011EED661|nr:hypothetical protein [Azospirillum brasilense]